MPENEWNELQVADLSDDVKGLVNRRRIDLDDKVTELARRACNALDGMPMEPDTATLAAETIALVRSLPTLI